MLHCPTCGRRYADGLSACPEDGAPLQADATIPAAAMRDPLVGQTLDQKYRLDARLGQGGMGTVYRATHLLIERPVAIKILNSRFVEDEEAQERFRREARAAGRLQHTNAVAVTDFGRTGEGVAYLVMELLEGRSLREVLAQEAPFAPSRAVALMLQIAAAVEAAHEAGVIHRDLKPGNIFLVESKHAPPLIKVLDFGIAKLAADASEEAETHGLTQTGVMIGTPRYMSPEQCDGVRLSPAADVYSLGVLLYEMLAGVTPFNGTTPLAVALQHSSKQPPPLRDWSPTLPPELDRVVMHALEKKPTERPPDAGAFRRELSEVAERLGLHAALLTGGLTTAIPPPPPIAETPAPASGALVFDVEQLREQHAKLRRPGETTLLAGAASQPAAISVNGEPPRAKPAILTSRRNHAPPPPRGGLTRLQVLIRDPQSWRQLIKRPSVLLAAGMVLSVLVFGVASLLEQQPQTGAEATDNAQKDLAETAPSPTPAAPSPAPTTIETAGNDERQQGARSGGSSRARNSVRTQQRTIRRKPKGNTVVRGLKKIFRNPF